MSLKYPGPPHGIAFAANLNWISNWALQVAKAQCSDWNLFDGSPAAEILNCKTCNSGMQKVQTTWLRKKTSPARGAKHSQSSLVQSKAYLSSSKESSTTLWFETCTLSGLVETPNAPSQSRCGTRGFQSRVQKAGGIQTRLDSCKGLQSLNLWAKALSQLSAITAILKKSS